MPPFWYNSFCSTSRSRTMPYVNHYPCSIEGCRKPRLAKGLCQMHYYRQYRTGTTDLNEPSAEDRFWPNVTNGTVHPIHGPCFVWTAGKFRRGYGAFCFNGKLVKA